MLLKFEPTRRTASHRAIAFGVIVLSFVTLSPVSGCASRNGSSSATEATESTESTGSAQAAESGGSGELRPRYQPRPPEPEPFYDTSYLFAMTRGVTGSTMHPVAQTPLLLFSIPLDIVFLPFAAIAGFF